MFNNLGFLLQHIFPLINYKVIPDHYNIDPIMDEILCINASLIVRDWNFTSSLSQMQLEFVKTGMGYRRKPVNLFDPTF